MNKRGKARFGVLWAAAGFIALAVPVNAAHALPQASDTTNAVSGLIVHYRSGAAVSQPNDGFLGQGVLSSAGFHTRNSAALGSGWHSVTFDSPESLLSAQEAVRLLKRLPQVENAFPDQSLRSQSVPVSQAPLARTHLTSIVTPLRSLVGAGRLTSGIFGLRVYSSATAVRSLRAFDAWNANEPATAAIGLNWIKPKNVFGAKITGYRVQVSIDGGKSVSYSQTIQGAATNAKIQRGVVAGQKVSTRVAALTWVSGRSRLGAYSAWVTATATTIPLVPKFITEPVATSTSSPRWQLLAGSETGGLQVTYTATASLAGNAVDSCTTTQDSCEFNKLDSGVAYKVSLKAANARGSATSFNPQEVTDPLFGYQWALGKDHGINVESAWTRASGQGVVVAVIDSGISDHPDLSGQLLRNADGTVYGYDFVTNPVNSEDGNGRDSDPTDPNGHASWHGTHVSGIIAAAANGVGVVGVAPGAKLLEIRALGANGGVESDLIASLHWAAGMDVPGTTTNVHPAKVINLSLGFVNSCDQATAAALQSLYNAGITVVTAAGNDSSLASVSYPGNCVPTINVGAANFTGDRSDYSNFGSGVDISAPGGAQQPYSGAPMTPDSKAFETGLILSTYNDGQDLPGTPNYGYEQGTSMAAPFVSGIAALIYSVRPDFTPDLVWQAIKIGSTPWSDSSSCSTANAGSQTCGAGIANAGSALTWALSYGH